MTDIEKDENNNQEEDFAALLDQYDMESPTEYSVGDKLTGKVVHRSKENLHVDIGTRSEAVLSLEDARTSDIQVNDEITVFIKRTSGEILLSLDPILGHGDFSQILEAFDQGTPLEGTVIEVNKGGFEVNIGGLKCFCPISQLATERIEKPEKWIGTTREFKVIEVDHKGKSGVVSHRQLIIDEENKKREELRTKLKPGAVLPGRVVEIMNFGAFIDLGGLRGLLHISEIAHSKVMRVEDVLKVDEELDVQILELTTDDRGRDRIKLSRKALMPNPWDDIQIEAGQVLKGIPVRTVSFGVFVKVKDGVEGLIPKRFLRQEGQPVKLEDVTLNEEAEFVVIEMNRTDQQMTLAFKGWDELPESHLKQGAKVVAQVIKVLPAGILVQVLDDPARGLLPKRFLEKMNQRKLFDTYPVGKELQLIIESIDEKGRYTFELAGKKDEVDSKTIEKYAEGDGFAHNPFADFFNK